MSTQHTIALFDWDTHFVETMRAWAESSGANIVHMQSPTSFEQFMSGPARVDLILVDIDMFRIDEFSPLGGILSRLAYDVPHLCLTSNKEVVTFHVAPQIAEYICMPKSHFVLHYDGLIRHWLGADDHEGADTQPVDLGKAGASKGHNAYSMDTLEEATQIQRTVLMAQMVMAVNDGVESTAEVLKGAIDRLSMLPGGGSHGEIIDDLEWAYKNVAFFSGAIRQMHQPSLQGVSRVDLRRTTAQVVKTIERTGRARQIVIETTLGGQPVWVQADPRHLEQIVTVLICSAVDAVVAAHATFRRIRVGLQGQETSQRAVLTLEDFAGLSHYEALSSAKEPGKDLWQQSLVFVQDLVTHYGGLFRVEAAARGTHVSVELPLDGAIDVTSPSHRQPLPERSDTTEVVEDAPFELPVAHAFEPMDTLDIPISRDEVFRMLTEESNASGSTAWGPKRKTPPK